MAVRARSGGVTGYAVGLVVFVILTVVGLILSILFYSQSEKFRTEAESARRLMRIYADDKRGDPTVLALEQLAQESGPSVVARLLDENQRLKLIVVGDANAAMENILKELEAGKLSAGKIVGEVTRLRELVAARERQIAQLEGEKAALSRDLAAAVAGRTALQQGFDQGVSAVRAQLTSVEADRKAFEATQQRQVTAITGQLSEVRDQATKSAAELRAEIDRLQAANLSLRNELDRLKGEKRPVPGGEPMLYQADGEIVSVVPQDNLVYINRGRNHRVMLGLPFEVFTRATGVISDDIGLRGKATIEVVRIGENSSAARIVRINRGESIVQGDLIANIAYDPNATYKFYVFGEFDVDNLGVATQADRRRVEAMISQWGGVLSSELTYDTDFVVLGKEPKLPEPPRDATNPEEVERHRAEQELFETYQRLVGEARQMSIPVLNQNRLLSLIGYYQR